MCAPVTTIIYAPIKLLCVTCFSSISYSVSILINDLRAVVRDVGIRTTTESYLSVRFHRLLIFNKWTFSLLFL